MTALLRRFERSGRGCERIELENMVVDAGRRAVLIGGSWIDLATAEFEVLWLLAEHAGRPVSRATICRELRGFAYDGRDRTIDLRVARIS